MLQSAEVTRKNLRERHNKKNPTQLNPVFPNWVYDRPALIGDFITGPSGPGAEPVVPVGRFSVTVSTHLLVNAIGNTYQLINTYQVCIY